MKSCYWKREKLEERVKAAEEQFLNAKALVAAWDIVYSGEDESAETLEQRAQKEYIRVQSVPRVADWTMEELTGFAPNKAQAQAKIKEIIKNGCGNAELDRAARAIFDENSYYASKYGYGR